MRPKALSSEQAHTEVRPRLLRLDNFQARAVGLKKAWPELGAVKLAEAKLGAG